MKLGALTVLAFSLVAGCGSSAGPTFGGGTTTSKFVGVWLSYTDPSHLQGFALKCDPEGTLEWQMKDPQDLGAVFDMHGTWREEPGKLYLKPTDMQLIGKYYADDANKKKLVDAMSKLVRIGEERTNSITWTNDNEFVADENGTKMTYSRKP
jgi:hypothetical protein